MNEVIEPILHANAWVGEHISPMAVPTILSFFFLILLFRPLEWAFPAKPGQRFFRPHWTLDLCCFLGQYLLWNGLVLGVLYYFHDFFAGIMPAEFRATVGSQPRWLQYLGVILLSDFCVYWGHRLQHNVGFLWCFHAVHHSAEHLDWLAAHREHPVDSIYTQSLINLPIFISGVDLSVLAGFIAFRGMWAIFIHTNVRLRLGWLRVLVGSPELHHWHHDKDRFRGNYANISPIMDVLFGTYRCPDHEPAAFGLHEVIAQTYLDHMVMPLLPRFREKTESKQEEPLEALS